MERVVEIIASAITAIASTTHESFANQSQNAVRQATNMIAFVRVFQDVRKAAKTENANDQKNASANQIIIFTTETDVFRCILDSEVTRTLVWMAAKAAIAWMTSVIVAQATNTTKEDVCRQVNTKCEYEDGVYTNVIDIATMANVQEPINANATAATKLIDTNGTSKKLFSMTF